MALSEYLSEILKQKTVVSVTWLTLVFSIPLSGSWCTDEFTPSTNEAGNNPCFPQNSPINQSELIRSITLI